MVVRAGLRANADDEDELLEEEYVWWVKHACGRNASMQGADGWSWSPGTSLQVVGRCEDQLTGLPGGCSQTGRRSGGQAGSSLWLPPPGTPTMSAVLLYAALRCTALRCAALRSPSHSCTRVLSGSLHLGHSRPGVQVAHTCGGQGATKPCLRHSRHLPS